MTSLTDLLRKNLEFDEKDAHRQAMLMGFDSNHHQEHKAFEYGSKSENSRLASTLSALIDCVTALEGIKLVVGTSSLQWHIADKALLALSKELGE